jgi:hypothetical protein
VAVVDGPDEAFTLTHPTTALLVIEVAVTSEALDRAMAAIYAEAGVRNTGSCSRPKSRWRSIASRRAAITGSAGSTPPMRSCSAPRCPPSAFPSLRSSGEWGVRGGTRGAPNPNARAASLMPPRSQTPFESQIFHKPAGGSARLPG